MVVAEVVAQTATAEKVKTAVPVAILRGFEVNTLVYSGAAAAVGFLLCAIGQTVQIFALLLLWPLAFGRAYQWVIDQTQHFFVDVMIMLHRVPDPDVELHFSGAREEDAQWLAAQLRTECPGERAVVISNHLAMLDWCYVWMLFHKMGRGDLLKIVLKKSLQKIPVIGWGIMFFRFVFLSRSWDSDQHTFDKALAWLRDEANRPLMLLLFPEGTFINSKQYKKSQEFSKKYGVPLYPNTLIPRTTGAYYVINRLRKQDSCKSGGDEYIEDKNGGAFTHLYDLTIAYTNIPKQNYTDDVIPFTRFFLKRKDDVRYKFLMRIERIPLEDVPREREAFDEWLYERFRHKSELVGHVREHNCWPTGSHVHVHSQKELPQPSLARLLTVSATCFVLLLCASHATSFLLAMLAVQRS